MVSGILLVVMIIFFFESCRPPEMQSKLVRKFKTIFAEASGYCVGHQRLPSCLM